MARIQLGALITNIAGSVGGTTFTRQRNGIVMSNKNKGQSLAKSQTNLRRVQLGYIFQMWSRLGNTKQNDWRSLAASYTFLDKFGNSKYLTGREFQIKMQSQLLPLSTDEVEPNEFNSNLPTWSMSGSTANFTDKTAQVEFLVSGGYANFMLSVDFELGYVPPIRPSGKQILIVAGNNSDFTLSYGSILFAKYPFLTPNYGIRVYVYAVNPSGWKSATNNEINENTE